MMIIKRMIKIVSLTPETVTINMIIGIKNSNNSNINTNISNNHLTTSNIKT